MRNFCSQLAALVIFLIPLPQAHQQSGTINQLLQSTNCHFFGTRQASGGHDSAPRLQREGAGRRERRAEHGAKERAGLGVPYRRGAAAEAAAVECDEDRCSSAPESFHALQGSDASPEPHQRRTVAARRSSSAQERAPQRRRAVPSERAVVVGLAASLAITGEQFPPPQAIGRAVGRDHHYRSHRPLCSGCDRGSGHGGQSRPVVVAICPCPPPPFPTCRNYGEMYATLRSCTPLARSS